MASPTPVKEVDVRNLTDKMHQRALFARGYLLTSHELDAGGEFPFFGNWTRTKVGAWNLYTHCFTKHYCLNANGAHIVLIGHAYNPFSRIVDESSLLEDAAAALEKSEKAFYSVVSEWSGRFVVIVLRDKEMLAVQDCAGMRTLFYGYIHGVPYLASHAQLLSDVCDLETTPWISDLVESREYKVGIRFLPGDVSPFSEVKRLGPNTSLKYCEPTFKVERFYPSASLPYGNNEDDQAARVTKIAELLRASLEIISEKWNSPAISLTGGLTA